MLCHAITEYPTENGHAKDLVDIISMVKHSAKEEELIFTAEEKVDNAVKKVMSNKSFNDEQRT